LAANAAPTDGRRDAGMRENDKIPLLHIIEHRQMATHLEFEAMVILIMDNIFVFSLQG